MKLIITAAILGVAFAQIDNSKLIGEICSIGNVPLIGNSAENYIACVQPKASEQDWPWKQIGVWTVKNCNKGKLFSPENRMCRNARTVRRQQQNFCNSYPHMCPYAQQSVQTPQIIVAQPQVIQQPQPVYQQQQQQSPCGVQGCQQVQQPQPIIEVVPISIQQPQQIIQPQPVQQPCGSAGCQPVIQPQPVQQPCGSGGCQPVIQPQPIQQPCGSPDCQPQQFIQPPMPVQQPCGGNGCQPVQQQCGPPPAQPCQPQPVNQCGPPPAPACPKPCPLAAGQGAQGARVGGMCSWMMDPLAQNAGNQRTYLQCQPNIATRNQYCGKWGARPCGAGTRFEPRLQVCVADPTAQPSCTTGTVPLGPCGQQNACPGKSVCQQQPQQIFIQQPAPVQQPCGSSGCQQPVQQLAPQQGTCCQQMQG